MSFLHSLDISVSPFDPGTQFYRDRQREESLDDDGDAFETLFRQQTVVAAILRHDSETDELEVASLGAALAPLLRRRLRGRGARAWQTCTRKRSVRRRRSVKRRSCGISPRSIEVAFDKGSRKSPGTVLSLSLGLSLGVRCKSYEPQSKPCV